MSLLNCYAAEAGLELSLLPPSPRAVITGVRQTTLSEHMYTYILKVVLDLFYVYRAQALPSTHGGEKGHQPGLTTTEATL